MPKGSRVSGATGLQVARKMLAIRSPACRCLSPMIKSPYNRQTNCRARVLCAAYPTVRKLMSLFLDQNNALAPAPMLGRT